MKMTTDILTIVVVLVVMLLLDMVGMYFKAFLYPVIASLIGFIFGTSMLAGSVSPNSCYGSILVSGNGSNLGNYPCVILNTYVNTSGNLIYDVANPTIFVLVVGLFTLMSVLLIFKFGRSA